MKRMEPRCHVADRLAGHGVPVGGVLRQPHQRIA